MSEPTLKLGIPAGSLQEATAQLFKKAGYRISFSSRSYYPTIDDERIECLLIRAQEMARYVEQGILDAGITGYDWVLETNATVVEVCELVFSKVSRRPVRWLLENHDVDHRWCLVHATHMDHDEVDALADSGAVAVLCPSTEANLGDGLFGLRPYLESGGRIAIGSDSHISINPFDELRWLEYGQRLASQSRNVAAFDDAHVGRELFKRVLEGGAQASGQGINGLEKGAPADLVALDDDDPMLLGHSDESRLDALVFSGYRLPIDRVMVAGRWCVVDGMHVTRADSRAVYGDTLARLELAR